jgi:hypothetical protein
MQTGDRPKQCPDACEFAPAAIRKGISLDAVTMIEQYKVTMLI